MKSRISILRVFFLVYNIMSVAGSTSSAAKETCDGGDFNYVGHAVLMTVPELVAQPSEKIVSVLGGIYEHSQWVAEKFTKEDEKTLKTVSTVSELAARLKSIVNESSDEQKLALLRAHPDLCEKVEAVKALTKESQEEQSRSGLQSMTEEELKQFKTMNESYKNKFGFPFILAVRNANKDTVLSALEGRLYNGSSQREFNIALEQVHNIAWMRLLTKVNTDDAAGFLTCHGKSLFDNIATCCYIKFCSREVFLNL
jgi:2-oxo-4-hydroxy-4-carboxy-5-ureidoimidazoline decarboxylase